MMIEEVPILDEWNLEDGHVVGMLDGVSHKTPPYKRLLLEAGDVVYELKFPRYAEAFLNARLDVSRIYNALQRKFKEEAPSA